MAAARDLIREYADSLDIDLGFQGFCEELASLPGRYAPPGGALFLASLDERFVGVCALRPLDADIGELKRLYVRPAKRRSGIGSRLLRAALHRAWAVSYRAVRLDTIPGMEAAQALYLQIGFRERPPYCKNPVPGARFFELERPAAAAARGEPR